MSQPPPVPSPTPSPAEARSTPVDGLEVVGALSPSRAGDFVACPLLYRFRTVDKLPEPTSVEALRGTLVHRVLEQLFDLPRDQRVPAVAAGMLEPAWAAMLAEQPELAAVTSTGAASGDWLAPSRGFLQTYFTLEDPRQLEPAERESYVEALLDSRLLLRGFVDRIDVNQDGDLRLVDYKTGRSPAEGFEAKALFQLRFYALIVWRTRGVIPRRLQLVYLGDGEVLSWTPDEEDLLATERKVEAIWAAISLARDSGDWQPNPSRLCDWCAHHAICPTFGGTPPPLPTQRPPEPASDR